MSYPPPTPPMQWARLFEREDVAASLSGSDVGINGFWTPLGNAAAASAGDEKTVLDVLAKISSLYVRPDDWNDPYGPAMRFDDRRTFIPSDLTSDEISLLTEVAPSIPHAGLRSRAFDLLFLVSSGAERVGFAQSSIDALVSEPIGEATWTPDHLAWDRALGVAQRFGTATKARMAKLEQALRAVVRTGTDGFVPLRAADLLAKFHLANDRSAPIANRLRKLADGFEGEAKLAYLRGASEWFARSGDEDSAAQAAADELGSMLAQAEALAVDDANAMRTAYLYERALQRVRQIPKAQRERLGLATLPRTAARRIRELNVLAIASMSVFKSAPIDLSGAIQESRDRVKGLSPEDALRSFSTILNMVSIDKEIDQAKDMIKESPLRSMLGNAHLTYDARVTYRSGGQGGKPLYGLDPPVWDEVVRSFEGQVNLMARGVLFPAWTQITNEHRLTLADFVALTAAAGIVPPDHVIQFARSMYYGFNGDFSTGIQLLAPQIEALVRFHFVDAGLPTSHIDDAAGTEQELGLSALMSGDDADTVFGRDLAFTIRLLFCGPTGPNLRNDVAHGLLSDGASMGPAALYGWWFGLRLMFAAFWNAVHEPEAADARERRDPSDEKEPAEAGPTRDDAEEPGEPSASARVASEDE